MNEDWSNSNSGEGKGSLYRAAREGKKDRVIGLLQSDSYAGWEEGMSKLTPLHAAAGRGHDRVVQVLLDEAPGMKDARDIHGRTPLHVAAEEGESPVVLLGYGVKVDAQDVSKRTPLHCAAEGGYKSVTEVLVENGARVSAEATYGNPPEFGDGNVLKPGMRVGRKHQISEMKPLHVAAWRGFKGVARVLIGNGAKVNATNDRGETPLKISVQYGDGEIASYLKRRGGEMQTSSGWGWWS